MQIRFLSLNLIVLHASEMNGTCGFGALDGFAVPGQENRTPREITESIYLILNCALITREEHLQK